MPKTLFKLTVADVQNIALKRIGRKLTDDEIYQVQKGIEFGLECWEDVIKAAVDEVGNSEISVKPVLRGKARRI